MRSPFHSGKSNDLGRKSQREDHQLRFEFNNYLTVSSMLPLPSRLPPNLPPIAPIPPNPLTTTN
jgi:hypothetical protein